MRTSKIPQYAQKIGEHVAHGCRAVMYQWMASKGYHTGFKPVEHLGIRVYRLDTQKIVREVATTDKRWIPDIKRKWSEDFNIKAA